MLDSSKLTFRCVCFSTNFKNFSSVSIMKQYFMSAQCFDINYVTDYHINFKNKISFEKSGQVEVANTFYELYSFSKANAHCKNSDCFIIFYDLESNESFRELNKILKYISEFCEQEKKIYFLSIYTNNEYSNNFSESNIKSSFSNYSLDNYNIFKVNMDSADELVKRINSTIEETLLEKMNANNLIDLDNSKSKCLIS